MKNSTSRFFLGVMGVAGLLMMCGPGAHAQSAAVQKTTTVQKAEPAPTGEPMEKAPADRQVVQADGSASTVVITDWSSHHMVFSNPAKATPAVREKIVTNPRYIMQLKRQALSSRTIKFNSEADRVAAESVASQNAMRTLDANSKSSLILGNSIVTKKPAPTPPPPAPMAGTRDWNMSLGNGTVAAGQFPAEVTAGESTITGTGGASPTGNCLTDFVVFGLNVVGTNNTATGSSPANGQANLIAFDDLYSGTTGSPICGTTANTKWAYNTSTISGTVSNSPVTSGDGTMVAFVENNNSAAVLHILKWKDSDGTINAPSTPATVASMSACSAAPCMASVQFSNNGDGISSPFYDFITDTIYVGDNEGLLYAITGVFYGTPTLVGSGPFAGGLQVSQFFGNLTSPVYDFTGSGNIFVGSSDGHLYAVNATTGVVSSLQVGSNGSAGAITDPPTVDSSNQRVIVSAGSNTGGTAAVVVQADTTTPLGNPVAATIGTVQGSLVAEQGAFDNNYYNWSGTGGNPGHFYVIGSTATTNAPTLYEIPFGGVNAVNISGTTTAGYTNPTVTFTASPQGAKFTATGSGSGGIFGITGGVPGSGFTSFPGVTITGTGTGASGAVTDVEVLTAALGSGGTNYGLIPNVTISGSGPGGETGTAALGIDAVTVSNGGSYTSIPTATFPGGSGTGKTSVGILTVGITAGGSYTNTVPTVTFTGGTGSGGAGTASMGVNAVTLTSGGSNYTAIPNVVFSGGGAGTGAAGTAALGLDVATVTNGGTYTSVPTVSFAGGSGTGAVSVGVQTIGVTAGGSFTSFPTVTIAGSGAGGGTASAVLGVTGANVTAGGTNYTSVPTVAVNGTGSGATASAALGLVTGTYAVTTGGSYTGLPSVSFPGGSGSGGVAVGVSSVSVTNAGSGYTTVPTFTISGTHTGGSATAAASMGLNAIAIGNAGTGYTTAPSISITGGTGSGASAAGETVTMKVVTAAVGTTCYSASIATENISLTGGSGSGAAVSVKATSRGSCSFGDFQLVINSVATAGSGYIASPAAAVPTTNCLSGCSNTITSTMGVNNISGTVVPGSYTALPTVAFSGGGGSGATLTASYSLVSVAVTNAGSYTTYPTIAISGGNATVAIGSTTVVSVVVSSAGTGYTAGPVAPSITGGPGSGAVPPNIPLAVVSVAASGGSYTTYPTLAFSGGGGSGAAATAVTTIQSVTVGNPGAYTTYPTASAGGGSTLSVTAATVVSIAITAGTGYTTGPVTAAFSGSGGAAATADLKVVSVTLTSPGSGYTADPTVGFDSGSAAGTTTIKVVSVTITAPGSYTVIPTAVHFSSGSATGSISAVLVVSVAVTAAGTGYTTGPVSVTFSGSGGAVATADLKVVTITLAGGGGDYTNVPTITITNQSGDTTGAGASATLTLGVLKVGLTAAGNGYTGTPTVTVSGGGGTGSTGWTATIAVNSVVLTYGGGDYSTPPTVTISGGSGAGVTGTATINPGNIMTTGTSPATLAVSATVGVQTSPISDVFNTATNSDTLFYGFGTATTTTDLAEVTVSAAGALGTTQTLAVEPNSSGGSSGIVVDPFTSGTNNQANSIYFATQGAASTDVATIKTISDPQNLSGPSIATVVTTAANDFVTGDTVVISGTTCTPTLFGCGGIITGNANLYNGTWLINVTNNTTFTLVTPVCSSCLAGSASSGSVLDDGNGNAKVTFKAVKLTQAGLQ